MSACDYCDHCDVCRYLNEIQSYGGHPWPGAQHEVYCMAEETDGPPYGRHDAEGNFVRLDRLFDRRMRGSL
jgi:hypothetical protein